MKCILTNILLLCLIIITMYSFMFLLVYTNTVFNLILCLHKLICNKMNDTININYNKKIYFVYYKLFIKYSYSNDYTTIKSHPV